MNDDNAVTTVCETFDVTSLFCISSTTALQITLSLKGFTIVILKIYSNQFRSYAQIVIKSPVCGKRKTGKVGYG